MRGRVWGVAPLFVLLTGAPPVGAGFFVPSGSTDYEGEAMTFPEMLDYARQVKEPGSHPSATAPKEVHVLEVLEQTAAVRVTAWWGSDYLHLAKYDGRWKIIHVLWQTAPREGGPSMP